MSNTKLSTTHTLLASAILLMIGVMACPNTPWDGGDPAREMERMHAGATGTARNGRSALESVNVLVHLADGDPAPGVAVRICDPESQASVGAGLSAERDRVLYESVTGADGRCVAMIRLPASLTELAVEWSSQNAVNEASWNSRESWQHVARTIVQRHELANLELSLSRP